MRLEQLVLYGPGEDDRVRFGPGVTVFAGLGADERTDLIETVVDALTGRLANASVIYTDRAGERIFADRSGATYAASGSRAPAPSDLLGHDPRSVAAMVTVTAADVGLGERVSATDVHQELTEARGLVERREVELAELEERACLVRDWQAELGDLTRRIDQADDDAAAWMWSELRTHLEELRSELTMFDLEDPGERDRRILDAVDALRTVGAEWTDAAAEATELRRQLGPVPEVSADDLARVAATPEELPADFEQRLDTWRAATDLRRAADAELATAAVPPSVPQDPLVVAFAAMDQTRLGVVHGRLEEANETYRQAAAHADRAGIDPDTEEAIEAAHLELVRRQREVDRRFRPGVLGAGTLAASALLAGHQISIILGVVVLVAAVALAYWLVAVPRRHLTTATLAEEAALSHADAGSWLGLHLRRLDAVTDVSERKRFEAAANARAAAQLDWDEVAGTLSPQDLTARADAVRAWAESTDPKAKARRRDEARALSSAATEAEAAARASLTGGLEAYGLVPGQGLDLAPDELSAILDHRVAAGRVARRARRLAVLEQRSSEAARRLDALLAHLGYTGGDTESRLERAIVAVTSARQRAAAGHRTRADVAGEILEVEQRVRAGYRPSWADRPAPSGPPTDPDLLHARRREIGELVSATGPSDLVGAEHRFDLARARVAELEARLEDLASGPASIQQHLIARLGRTSWLDGQEDTLPALLDDPLVSVPVAERMDLLDQLVRLSVHAQVILLSEDPVVARWARDRSRHPSVVLYEATLEDLPPAPTPAPAALDLTEPAAFVEIY